MPLARQLTVLDLYDVLTNLVPGATVLLFAFLLFRVESTALAGSTATLVFVVLLGSLLVGHVLQWLRGEIGKQPNEFQNRMAAVRDGNPKNSIHEDFLEMTNEHFKIDNDLNDRERFRLVLSYLETRPFTRAIRFQSVYSFYRSLYPASLIAAGLALAAGVIYCLNWDLVAIRGPFYIFFSLGGAALLAYVSRERRNKFEGVFVGYAIREFYQEQLVENGEESTPTPDTE